MTGQPKDSQKEYSPQWGGGNRGQGRKPSPWRKQVLILACSADELEAIQAEFTPRQRAEILLQAAGRAKPAS